MTRKNTWRSAAFLVRPSINQCINSARAIQKLAGQSPSIDRSYNYLWRWPQRSEALKAEQAQQLLHQFLSMAAPCIPHSNVPLLLRQLIKVAICIVRRSGPCVASVAFRTHVVRPDATRPGLIEKIYLDSLKKNQLRGLWAAMAVSYRLDRRVSVVCIGNNAPHLVPRDGLIVDCPGAMHRRDPDSFDFYNIDFGGPASGVHSA